MRVSMDSDTHPRLLSVSEVAIRFGTSAGTIRRWIAEGRLAAVQPAGERGLVRVPEDELDRLIGQARQDASS
jgi:excisionase family DNA binding protein